MGGLYSNQAKIFSECINDDVVCLLETFTAEGDESYLQLPNGYSYVTCPAVRSKAARQAGGIASGSFGILYNCRKVSINPNLFVHPTNGIFYGPVFLQDNSKVYVVSIYRTKNLKSAVYDKDFFDALHEVLLSLKSEKVILPCWKTEMSIFLN